MDAVQPIARLFFLKGSLESSNVDELVVVSQRRRDREYGRWSS